MGGGGVGSERERKRESSVVVLRESRIAEGTGVVAVPDSCHLLAEPARGSLLD